MFRVPVLAWKLVLERLVEWWKTFRGITGITFLTKQRDA